MAKEIMILTDSEWQKLLTELMEIIRSEALVAMKKHVKKANLKLTGELERSMYDMLKVDMTKVYGEVVVGFQGYGRFKDMKYLNYDGQWREPNNNKKKYSKGGSSDKNPAIVDMFVEYVKKIGLSKVKYIPGYFTDKAKRMPTTDRTIQRVAWAMASNRLRQGRVKRSKAGWYNDAIKEVRTKVRRPISEHVAAAIAKSTASAITRNMG